MPVQILPFPQELCPQLPTNVGDMGCLSLRPQLEQIESLLRESGLEPDFVQGALALRKAAGSRETTAPEQLKSQQRSRRALRCLSTEDHA